ncbi:MAG: molybdopterin synthase catalytic subunit MoaE [Pseudomonadales bacterium]|jgi:molybdopterin synthase catalytic subunit|nr:molybdopterin synthase catalytic subunit MoaE [Pseudomonadales bacterium]MCP5337962.1 molybdopterin synthase catalytic subunit MoaE [Pseudomonadales bacterium]
MTSDVTPEVEIREADFSVDEEYRRLRGAGGHNGACVLFSGLVREHGACGDLQSLELEHYPGMTEASIAAIVVEARTRWRIGAVRVIHRVGRLVPADQIVLVGVASAHRGDAFAACEFIMDYLKTRAPIWKKETAATASHWVESRDSDTESAARWSA